RKKASQAQARRELVAEAVGKQFEAIARLVPEAYPEQSTRGIHAVIVLDEEVEAGAARRIGQAIRAAAGLPESVEVFPRRSGKGHVMCRMPGTGEGRLLDASLTGFRNKRRAADQLEVADGPRVGLFELAARAGAVEDGGEVVPDGIPDSV